MQIQCLSRTEGAARPTMPPWDNQGEFIIKTSDAFIEFNALLDMAQKDLQECND